MAETYKSEGRKICSQLTLIVENHVNDQKDGNEKLDDLGNES